jgi:EAL domain-containing protein (putative c-di-GMP-specific phosphodiesterase class I)
LPSLINIIRDLGAKPIIEGIETQAQLDIALEAGGSLLQGYFLGRPVTAKELQPSNLFKSGKTNVRKVA